jgi:chorismate mutase / prephenate dehydratase
LTLDELRNRIDALDGDIVRLLNERATCAQQIGELKKHSDTPIYVPERERSVFAKLAKNNQAGPLSDASFQAIYREVISAIRALEKATSVAFLGPRDTFSHMAAIKVFGQSADYHPLPSFADVFMEVERKRIDYGVVPVESSMGGSVSDTLDHFITADIRIVNEVELHITQNLLSNSPQEKIRRVYSKDNALMQCRNWLRANLPQAELVEVSSTAEAARRAAEETGTAAIASRLAAQTYNLELLVERVEDAPHNFTRFFVLGKQAVARTGKDKTSLVISVLDKPGALHNLLLPFASKGINLTRIESRPSKLRAWEYVFFVDLLGHIEDDKVKAVLEEISKHAKQIKVLGSFPHAEREE